MSFPVRTKTRASVLAFNSLIDHQQLKTTFRVYVDVLTSEIDIIIVLLEGHIL